MKIELKTDKTLEKTKNISPVNEMKLIGRKLGVKSKSNNFIKKSDANKTIERARLTTLRLNKKESRQGIKISKPLNIASNINADVRKNME